MYVWSRIAGVERELSELDADVRKVVEQEIHRYYERGGPIFAPHAVLYIAASAVLGGFWDRAWLPAPFNTRLWSAAIRSAVMIGIILCGLIAWGWLARRRYRAFVRAMIRARGVPLCMVCGYNLTANAAGYCPECGSSLEHSIRLADEVLARYGRGDSPPDSK